MIETISKSIVPVNVGRLLENQLKKWQGGGHHPGGIASIFQILMILTEDYGNFRQKK